MADDRRDPAATPTDDEGRIRSRFRIVAARVILVLIVLTAVVDLLGRLLVNPNFEAGGVIFGTLVGALLVLAVGESAGKLPFINGGNGK